MTHDTNTKCVDLGFGFVATLKPGGLDITGTTGVTGTGVALNAAMTKRLAVELREYYAPNAASGDVVVLPRSLAVAFDDDEPCRLDHERYCQSHGLTRPCIVAELRELLNGSEPTTTQSPQEAGTNRDEGGAERKALSSTEPPRAPEQGAGFGEPWLMSDVLDEGRTGIVTRENGIVFSSVPNSRVAFVRRAIACVNACAGLSYPAEAIAKAREALRRIGHPTYHESKTTPYHADFCTEHQMEFDSCECAGSIARRALAAIGAAS